MPIIKSAKKRVKQTAQKTKRNNVYRRRLHDIQKEFYDLVEAKETGKAEKMLPEVYKIIDTCSKRNLIHDNKAARLKSKASKAISSK